MPDRERTPDPQTGRPCWGIRGVPLLLVLAVVVGLGCRFPFVGWGLFALLCLLIPTGLGMAALACLLSEQAQWRPALGAGLVATLWVGGLCMLAGQRGRPGCDNETSAIHTMRALVTSMEQFRSAAIVDVDADGRGEYGFLRELAGTTPPRTRDGWATAPAYPPFVTSVLGDTAWRGGGIASKSGYHFRVYLPGDRSGQRVLSETGALVPGDAAAADAQEQHFIVYAWPAARGASGHRAFVIDERGVLHATANADLQGYDGTTRIPTWDAALVFPGGDRTLSSGVLRCGEPSADGGLWLPGCGN